MAKLDLKKSGVIWVSGYSSSGKTTVGQRLEYLLRKEGHSTIFLDGDQLRSIFGNKWDYSAEQRAELAIIYFRLCGHLSKQGFIVIISAVAMLDEARRWFKQNIENGFEVYLNVPETERVNRDLETQKFIYNKASLDNSVYTPPVKPDIFINNFGDLSSQDAATVIAKKYLERAGRSTVDYGRSEYWSQFYLSQPQSQFPSPFAQYCATKLSAGQTILEIGCGNGRDARFFAKAGFQVVGIDKSEEAISYAPNKMKKISHIFVVKRINCKIELKVLSISFIAGFHCNL